MYVNNTFKACCDISFNMYVLIRKKQPLQRKTKKRKINKKTPQKPHTNKHSIKSNKNKNQRIQNLIFYFFFFIKNKIIATIIIIPTTKRIIVVVLIPLSRVRDGSTGISGTTLTLNPL